MVDFLCGGHEANLANNRSTVRHLGTKAFCALPHIFDFRLFSANLQDRPPKEDRGPRIHPSRKFDRQVLLEFVYKSQSRFLKKRILKALQTHSGITSPHRPPATLPPFLFTHKKHIDSSKPPTRNNDRYHAAGYPGGS